METADSRLVDSDCGAAKDKTNRTKQDWPGVHSGILEAPVSRRTSCPCVVCHASFSTAEERDCHIHLAVRNDVRRRVDRLRA